ncbi:hypothetical protein YASMINEVIRUS_615 [Yasminevirus sp. GU-2018]|uniref:Uncharacterized protein n=1 Tax=Yasminevirus sp. GU-2018 TaxID=2420051 RepID=A0A5K0U9L6_9VIRU|nr:hypothetical protein YASMINEVIRUS_615 [Yasminevirus sp. GU-2018]
MYFTKIEVRIKLKTNNVSELVILITELTRMLTINTVRGIQCETEYKNNDTDIK